MKIYEANFLVDFIVYAVGNLISFHLIKKF
jgi:hypothetical protein